MTDITEQDWVIVKQVTNKIYYKVAYKKIPWEEIYQEASLILLILDDTKQLHNLNILQAQKPKSTIRYGGTNELITLRLYTWLGERKDIRENEVASFNDLI